MPYDYRLLVALALGQPVAQVEAAKCMTYVCSGYVAEALRAGGARLRTPGDWQGVVEPVDLVQQLLGYPEPELFMRTARIYARLR